MQVVQAEKDWICAEPALRLHNGALDCQRCAALNHNIYLDQSCTGMGVLFGGVHDEDRNEETLDSVFYNDLYISFAQLLI